MEINVLRISGIYCIENTISKKMYVGSSINVYKRLIQHRSLLRGGYHNNRIISNSWNKNGEDCFKCYLLEEVLNEFLAEREQFWINKLNPEFNITKEVVRNTPSEESKKLISKTLKSKYLSGEIKPTRTTSIDIYDLNFVKINSFETLNEASIFTTVEVSVIGKILNGTYAQSKGFYFTKKGEKIIKIKTSKKGSKVTIIDELGIEAAFLSFAEAARSLNTDTGNLHKAYKKNKRYKNYVIQVELPAPL